jgi:hypothetical protein
LNVKAHSLLISAKWVQEKYGDHGLAEVLRRCSDNLRDRYTTVLPIEWHPQEELIEFISTVEQTFGDQSGRLCVQIGAATAKANLGGFVKQTIFYFANREYLLRRVAALWRQFNDAGELRVLEFDERKARMELLDIPTSNRYFCALITGWSCEVGRAFGVKHPQARHVACIAEKGERCLWQIDWQGFSFDEEQLKKSQDVWDSKTPERVK